MRTNHMWEFCLLSLWPSNASELTLASTGLTHQMQLWVESILSCSFLVYLL